MNTSEPWHGFWADGFWIFPILMPIVMLIGLYLVFGRGGFRGCCGLNGRSEDPQDRKIAASPMEILKQRYAKGEITKDEFEEIKKGLE